MKSYNILFICGSLNQTKMMHAISTCYNEHNIYFTPYFADGLIDYLTSKGLLSFTPLGGKHKEMTLEYLHQNDLSIDYKG